MITVTQNCTFSNPVRYDGTTPTLPTHTFYFENSVCEISDNATTTPIATSTELLPQPVFFQNATTVASTSDVIFTPFFTAGDVIQIALMILLIIILIVSMVIKSLARIKTTKKYLQYSGGDVEIRNDL